MTPSHNLEPSQADQKILRVVPRSGNSLLSPTPGQLERLAQKAPTSQPGPTPVKTAPTRSLRRKLSPEVIRKIVRRYKSGEYTTDLSREYGISKSGLLKLLRSEGVSLRMQPITPKDEHRAVKIYEGGMTINQMAERVGYSYGTIRRVLHENGVAVRSRAIGKRETPE